MITLGDKVKCNVSGFTGIATSRLEHINKCSQIGITPQSKDNKYPETIWVDEPQLKVIKAAVIKAPKIEPGKPGGSNTKVRSV